MNFPKYGVAFGLLMIVLVACTQSPVERAVKGKLLPSEANVAVNNYCQSCHVHSQFVPEKHLEKVQPMYPKGNELRAAANCLQCHSISLPGVFRKEVRSTIWPHGKLIDMAVVPRPSDQPAPARKAAEPDVKKPEKKKRKWYFFYLF